MPATQSLQFGTGLCEKSMTDGRESINRRELFAAGFRHGMKRTLLCYYIFARDLYLNLVGDDITIACFISWMSRLIFDRESVNHNADNTGVLIRRRVLKIADRHTITTSRGDAARFIFRRPAPIKHYYVSCKERELPHIKGSKSIPETSHPLRKRHAQA